LWRNLSTKVHALTFQRDLCLNHCETSDHTCNVAFLPFMSLNIIKLKTTYIHCCWDIFGACGMSPQNLFHDITNEEQKNRLHLCADLLQYAGADENLIRSVLMVSET